MRILTALVVILLAGCASSRGHVGYCAVLEYGGKLGAPHGLVSLSSELESDLRSQLPPDRAGRYICWYATGDQILASDRGGGALYGRVFKRSGSAWLITGEDESVILQLPRP